MAIVPLHALAQEEHQVPVVVLPRPLLGQLADDRVQALDFFIGSKSTRLLKQGMLGQTLEIVAVS
jgi:hypothetical protein